MKAKDLVEKFNKQFPVGATVPWRSIGKAGVSHKDYTVRFAARDQNGQPVAWFNERSGMVSIEPQFVNYERGGESQDA
jgi:hypothetical protein